MAERKIEVRRVYKTFTAPHEVEILDDVSLSIAPRQFVCLVGPSGCGKSTLLNLIAGFDRPSAGRVLFNGHDVQGPEPARMVVFQEPTLFPWLTVRQNLAFGLTLRRQRASPARARIPELTQEYLDLVGLRGFEDHYAAEISGGMKQRLEIARALIMQPEVLLMDEPFGALDAQTRLLMQQLLLSVWDRFRQAVLFITHDIEEAILLGDVVHVMTARPGRIKRTLEIELRRPRGLEILTTPAFNVYKAEIWDSIREESVRAIELHEAQR